MAALWVNDAMSLEALFEKKSVSSVRLFAAKTVDLSRLAKVRGLTELEIHSFRGTTFSFIAPLKNLTSLTLIDFPNVVSVTPLADLSKLRSLKLALLTSKLMNGKTQTISSYQPLASLKALEELVIEGIIPKTGGLSPLWNLPKLRQLDCDNRYGIDDYAGLRRHQPKLACPWLQPLREARSCDCPKCGVKGVVLCGSKPRRVICPKCKAKMVAAHEAAWQTALASIGQ